jgi:hypothetical protein
VPSNSSQNTIVAEELDEASAEDELGKLELEISSSGGRGSLGASGVLGEESLPQAVSERRNEAKARGRMRVSMVVVSYLLSLFFR